MLDFFNMFNFFVDKLFGFVLIVNFDKVFEGFSICMIIFISFLSCFLEREVGVFFLIKIVLRLGFFVFVIVFIIFCLSVFKYLLIGWF